MGSRYYAGWAIYNLESRNLTKLRDSTMGINPTLSDPFTHTGSVMKNCFFFLTWISQREILMLDCFQRWIWNLEI